MRTRGKGDDEDITCQVALTLDLVIRFSEYVNPPSPHSVRYSGEVIRLKDLKAYFTFCHLCPTLSSLTNTHIDVHNFRLEYIWVFIFYMRFMLLHKLYTVFSDDD